MKITNLDSNERVASELGERVRDTRIAIPLTREELARKSGVSMRTIGNIERGADVTCSSLFAVLRALGMLGNADLLVPEQGARPSDLAVLGKKRVRATSPKHRTIAKKRGSWTWGEDA